MHLVIKMEFVPLLTTEYKYAFCNATRSLPTDIQKIIWEDVLRGTQPICPDAPRKRRSPLVERLRRRGRKLAKELVY